MFSIIPAIVATVFVFIFYLLSANAVKSRWGYKLLISPLKITAETTGRASLSKTQVYFFTLAVAWLSVYWFTKAGELVPLNNSIIILLGIAAGGAGLGRVAGTANSRVTGENWAWARRKKWIKNDFTQAPSQCVPKFSDLFTADQRFEVSRFQAVIFSVIIGSSLLYEGITIANIQDFKNFSIDNTYLVLMGLSQGVYVGGKTVGANPIPELNTKLNKVRELELAFTTAVVKSSTWSDAAVGSRDMQLARAQCAPSEYTAYMSAAMEAAEIVGSLTGSKIDATYIQPELPI